MIKQLLFYLAFIVFCYASISAQTRLVTTPAFKHIVKNKNVVVKLNLENAVNLHSASVTITYDSSVINLTSITNGSILTGLVFSNTLANSMTIDLTNLDLSQFTGSGTLFTLTFNSHSLGTSPVCITDIKLRDNNNNPLPIDTVSGSIYVSGPPSIVYINHSFTELNSATHEWGYDAFAIIQDGIDAVIDSGTVSINSDVYNENTIFNKNLTLISTGTNESIINKITVIDGAILNVKSNLTIGNSISCTSGKVITDTSIIDLRPTATITESDGNYIIGNLRISQLIGINESNFGNIGVEINSGIGDAGNITVLRVSGPTGKILLGSVESINRKWIISSDLIPVPGRILKFQWVSDDGNGIGSQGRVFKSSNNGISWTSSGPLTPVDDNSISTLPLSPLSFVWTISDGDNNLQNETGFVVNAKVYLQGAFSGSEMRTNLNSYGYLPLTQPYSAPPFNYSGPEYVEADFFSNHNNIVDWILIEVRSNTSSASVIDRRAAFLLKNGAIVDLNGTNPVEFKGIIEGNYYLVIRHRNHLAIMSSISVGLNLGSSIYDFTTSQSKAYNSSYSPMKQLGDGKYGLYAGDANSDGTTDSPDINLYWRPNNGTIFNYSKYADFNLDGTIDALDINLFWRSNNGVSALVP